MTTKCNGWGIHKVENYAELKMTNNTTKHKDTIHKEAEY